MSPIRLAIVDDYDVVVAGVAAMFREYTDRVEVVELAANEPVRTPVDIALFDTFAQGESDSSDLDVLLANPLARRVAVYTWVFQQRLIDTALRRGVCGYLSKTLPAGDLVRALEAVHAGRIVVEGGRTTTAAVATQDWPGRTEGLTAREAEMLALITQGKSNTEIAALCFLSVNTVKTHIRTGYAKIGATTRAQAVLWGVRHGLHIETRRVHDWSVTASDAGTAQHANVG